MPAGQDERSGGGRAPTAGQSGQRELRAWAHPLRLRILSLLTGAAMSAAEVARELGTTQANASYHLRQLEAAGPLRVVEEVAVRGGRAKRYRHVPEEFDDAPVAEQSSRVAISEVTWRALTVELSRRAPLSSHAAPASQLVADAELWVDEADWHAAVRDVHAAMRRLHERARPPRSGGTVRVSATVALFQMRLDEPERPAPAHHHEVR
ncbi:MAG: ArsR/SmtB family transcription factor [Actinomycetes bacterium]